MERRACLGCSHCSAAQLRSAQSCDSQKKAYLQPRPHATDMATCQCLSRTPGREPRHLSKCLQASPAHSPRAVMRCYCSAGATAPKAALMVIGDEVLSGSIVDSNTPWLAKLLYNRGVDLVKVEIVPDHIPDIVDTAKRLRERVGPSGSVFSSGGIGPTHDDVTYEAMASAFGTELALHAPTVERMKVHYEKRGVELNEARLRMATLPRGAEVLFTEGLWVPLVNLHGVYILPGIPSLFQRMVEAHAERWQGPAAHSDVLYTHMGEGDLAEPLGEVAKAHPMVRIGSYPADAFMGSQKQFNAKLQFESRDPQALAEAVADAQQRLSTFRLAG